MVQEPTELRPGIWIAFVKGPAGSRIEVMQLP
jgi:hypothetical protein